MRHVLVAAFSFFSIGLSAVFAWQPARDLEFLFFSDEVDGVITSVSTSLVPKVHGGVGNHPGYVINELVPTVEITLLTGDFSARRCKISGVRYILETDNYPDLKAAISHVSSLVGATLKVYVIERSTGINCRLRAPVAWHLLIFATLFLCFTAVVVFLNFKNKGYPNE